MQRKLACHSTETPYYARPAQGPIVTTGVRATVSITINYIHSMQRLGRVLRMSANYAYLRNINTYYCKECTDMFCIIALHYTPLTSQALIICKYVDIQHMS